MTVSVTSVPRALLFLLKKTVVAEAAVVAALVAADVAEAADADLSHWFGGRFTALPAHWFGGRLTVPLSRMRTGRACCLRYHA